MKPEAAATKPEMLTCRVTSELMAKLEAIAKSHEVTRSDFLRNLIEKEVRAA